MQKLFELGGVVELKICWKKYSPIFHNKLEIMSASILLCFFFWHSSILISEISIADLNFLYISMLFSKIFMHNCICSASV